MNLYLPDTPLAVEALAVLRAAAPRAIVNHSIRSYLLAAAYGARKAMPFDHEGLFLAAAFHDLGLCAGYRNPRNPFQVNSSHALREFLAGHGYPAVRIEPLVEAVDFHFQLLPRWQAGPEVGLLQTATWIDITRLRRWEIMAEAREIERRFPRAGIDLLFPWLVAGSVRGVRSCVGLLLPHSYREQPGRTVQPGR